MSDATQSGDEQVPYADLFTALAAPFADGEVKVREQAGRKFHYITARTAMNRLDSVLGPSRWWDEYVPGNNGVLCRLTIRLPDGTTLTKCDAGGYAGMADQGDDEKSGVSDAFKRAAVKFGVGRYIYNDGVPDFVLDRLHGDAKQAVLPGGARSSGGGGGSYSGNRGGGGGGYNQGQRRDHDGDAQRAALAERFGNKGQAQPQGNGQGQSQGQQRGQQGNLPRSGRALFAWCKEQEQKYEVGLVKYLQQWGGLQEFPARMVDWDADHVKLAYDEATRKLQAIQATTQEAYEDALSN